MNTLIQAVNTTAPGIGSVVFSPVQIDTGLAWNATEGSMECVWPVAGNFVTFRLRQAVAPGAAHQYAYTLRVNEADSVLVVTIAGASQLKGFAFGSVAINPGDRLSISCLSTAGSAATGVVQWGFDFVGTNTNESATIGGQVSTQLATNSTQYYGIQGSNNNNPTETSASQPMPTAGTFTGLYVDADVAPGAAQSLTLTLFKNGSSTGITVALSGASQKTNNITGQSISVAQGDLFSIQAVNTNGAAAVRFRWGLIWKPTTDGESVGLVSNVGTQAQALTRFKGMAGSGASQSTEANAQTLGISGYSMKKLYVRCKGAPVANGQTLTTTMRQNGSSVSPAVTLTGDGSTDPLTGSDATATNLADDDLLNLQLVTSATSGSVNASAGVVWYQAVASTETYPELERFQPRGLKRGVFSGW